MTYVGRISQRLSYSRYISSKNTIFRRHFQDAAIVIKIVISRVNILKLGRLDTVNLSISTLQPISVPTTPTRYFFPSFLK